MATEKSTPALMTRARSAPRREPRFEDVTTQEGLQLGFRCMPTGSESWVAKWIDRDSASGRKEVALRTHMQPTYATDSDAYVAATLAAVDAFKAARRGVKIIDMTVAQLCAKYADAIEKGGHLHLEESVYPARPGTATKTRAQQRRWILGSAADPSDLRGYAVDPIAKVKVKNITSEMCLEWRERVKANRKKVATDATINKDIQPLRAALNYGKDILKIEGLQDHCWEKVLEKLTTPGAKAKRVLYLNQADRAAIAAKATPEVKRFMKLVSVTSFRPGACAGLTTLSPEINANGTMTVTVGKDKTKKATGRKVLVTSPDTIAFIKELCADKIGNARLLTQADGSAWDTRKWGSEFKKAVRLAFPKGDKRRAACLYTLRHCAITDLINANQPIAMVAHWAGTSTKQIEETYLNHEGGQASSGLALLVANY